MHGFTAIEDAILAALEPVKASLKIRELKSYAGEIDADKLKTRTVWPFCLVTNNGTAEVDNHGSRKVEKTRWVVIVGDRDQADLAKARRGGTGAGTYAMLRGVQALIEGRQVLPDLLPADRLGEETLLNEAGMSVIACHYEIGQPYLVDWPN